MNWDDLIDRTLIGFKDKGLRPAAAKHLIEAQEDFILRTGCLTKHTAIEVESGEAYADIPDDFIRLLRAEWNGKKLLPATKQYMKSCMLSDETFKFGVPTHYHSVDNKMYLYPAPASTDNLNIWYVNRPWRGDPTYYDGAQDHCIVEEVLSNVNFMCWYNWDDGKTWAGLITNSGSYGPVTEIGSGIYCIGNPRAVKIRAGTVAFATTDYTYGDGTNRYKLYGQVITCYADLTMKLPGNTMILEAEPTKGFYSFFGMEAINGDDEFTIVAKPYATWKHVSAYGFTVSGNVITQVGTAMAHNAFWYVGAGWSLETTASRFVATNASTTVESDRADIEDGETYLAAFTVENYDSGSVKVRLGGVDGTVASGNGTVYSYITAGATGKIELVGTGFTGDVKSFDVFVCQDHNLDDNAYWSKGAGWTVPGNGTLHIQSASGISRIEPVTPLKLIGKMIIVVSWAVVTGSYVNVHVGGWTDTLGSANAANQSAFIATTDDCYIETPDAATHLHITQFSVRILSSLLNSAGMKDNQRIIKTKANEAMLTMHYNGTNKILYGLLLTQSAGTPTWTEGSAFQIDHTGGTGEAGANLEDDKVVVSCKDYIYVLAISNGTISLLTKTVTNDIDTRFSTRPRQIAIYDANTFVFMPSDDSSVYHPYFAVVSLDGNDVPALDFAVRINSELDAMGGYNALNGVVGKFTNGDFLAGYPEWEEREAYCQFEIYSLDELLYGPIRVYTEGDIVLVIDELYRKYLVDYAKQAIFEDHGDMKRAIASGLKYRRSATKIAEHYNRKLNAEFGVVNG